MDPGGTDEPPRNRRGDRMSDFLSFQPGRLSGGQAYSMVKGQRIAFAALASLTMSEGGQDLPVALAAEEAHQLLVSASHDGWVASARAAGYTTNHVSDDARAVALSALAFLAGLPVDAPEAEEVAV